MFVSDNTVSTFITYFKNELKAIYDEREIDSILNIVFQSVFSWDKIQLRMNKSQSLSKSDLSKLKAVLNRLLKNEPIQYVIGETEFYGLKFKVDSRALIPRQETEELVDLILKETSESELKILDIGTGSGCIPIALKTELPNAHITSIDISTEAISLAKENAKLNNAEISFHVLDVFSEDVFNLGEFDIIVSNPPYISNSEKEKMSSNVLDYEPHNALFVENDALEFYERIIQISKQLLKSEGALYFELNERYKVEYLNMFEVSQVNGHFIEDLNGKTRMAKISF